MRLRYGDKYRDEFTLWGFAHGVRWAKTNSGRIVKTVLVKVGLIQLFWGGPSYLLIPEQDYTEFFHRVIT